MSDLNHVKDCENIDTEEKKIIAETKKLVQAMKTESEQSVLHIGAESKVALKNCDFKEFEIETTTKFEIADKKKQIQTQTEADIMKLKAKTRKEVAELLSSYKTLEGNIEKEVSSQIAEKRKHELRLSQLENQKHYADNSTIVISGEQGDQILDYYLKADKI